MRVLYFHRVKVSSMGNLKQGNFPVFLKQRIKLLPSYKQIFCLPAAFCKLTDKLTPMPSSLRLEKNIKKLYKEEKYKEIVDLLTDETLEKYNNAGLYYIRYLVYKKLAEIEKDAEYIQKSELDYNRAVKVL